MNSEEIKNVNPKNYDVIFADTSIIQEVLGKFNKSVDYNSYHPMFITLFKRKIEVVDHSQLLNCEKPFFVKPYDNYKSFEAVIVETEKDINLIPKSDQKYYKCQFVKFVNEFRLFVSPGKYEIIESSDFIISSSKIKRTDVDQKFIEDILKVNTFDYVIIDIGCIEISVGVFEWVIVEINPPYSLTSYNLDIEIYYNYCVNAWKNLIIF